MPPYARSFFSAEFVQPAHGASDTLLIKGMETSKSGAGFRRVYEALGLDVCLDPIHTSGLRKFAIEEDGVYEEVNKPDLASSQRRRSPASYRANTSRTSLGCSRHEERSSSSGSCLELDGGRDSARTTSTME